MREVIIFDTDDLAKICAGEEIDHRMNDGKVLTFMSKERYEQYKVSKFCESDIHLNLDNLTQQYAEIKRITNELIRNMRKGGINQWKE